MPYHHNDNCNNHCNNNNNLYDHLHNDKDHYDENHYKVHHHHCNNHYCNNHAHVFVLQLGLGCMVAVDSHVQLCHSHPLTQV